MSDVTARDREAEGDRELVYSARGGDERAFDVLFYRYRDGIYRLALAITKDPDAAEEIVLDTFARAYRALERLEPNGTLRPWLYRVAVNLSYNRRPRAGVTLSSLDEAAELATPDEGRSPSQLAEAAELRTVVLQCIDALSPKHRLVVVLHYLNELSLAEIAEIADCPVGTVKSRLHYALLRLREHLSAHPGLEPEPAVAFRGTGGRMPNRFTEALP